MGKIAENIILKTPNLEKVVALLVVAVITVKENVQDLAQPRQPHDHEQLGEQYQLRDYILIR
jgi:hypothetical protein